MQAGRIEAPGFVFGDAQGRRSGLAACPPPRLLRDHPGHEPEDELPVVQLALMGTEPLRCSYGIGRQAAHVPMVRIQHDALETYPAHLASTARVKISAATGVPQQVHDPRAAGFWSLVNALMEPLHFGDFGGLALKWLYFILGMTPAFLSISGTLIWLDARQQRRREAQAAQSPSPSGIAAAG